MKRRGGGTLRCKTLINLFDFILVFYFLLKSVICSGGEIYCGAYI